MLRPTGSVEIARSRLETLATGGETPLAEGIRLAADLARHSATADLRPLLVLVTDGRATSARRRPADPVTAALTEAAAVASQGLPAVVVDVEPPPAPAWAWPPTWPGHGRPPHPPAGAHRRSARGRPPPRVTSPGGAQPHGLNASGNDHDRSR